MTQNYIENQNKNQQFLTETKEQPSSDKSLAPFIETLMYFFEKCPEVTLDIKTHILINRWNYAYQGILFDLISKFQGIPVVPTYKISIIATQLLFLLGQEISPQKASDFLYETINAIKTSPSNDTSNFFKERQKEILAKYYNSDFYNHDDALILDFQYKITHQSQMFTSSVIPSIIFRNRDLVTPEDQIKTLQCYLRNTEKIRDILLQNNLEYLQKKYPKSFKIFTHENRLCKNKPEPSKSPRLIRENIQRLYTHSCGRDVYNISRTYQMSPEKTESLFDYRRARQLAEGWKFNSNTTKVIDFPKIPYITSGNIAYQCSRELMIFRLKETLHKKYPQSSLGMIDSFVHVYYPLLREKTYDIVLNIIEMNKGMDTNDFLHDVIYPYIDIPQSILTPSLQKHLLQLSINDLNKKWGFLIGVHSDATKDEIKSLRKTIYSCFRKKMSPEEIMNVCDMMQERQIIEAYNLSHEQLEQISKYFLPVIRRYNNNITPSRFIKIFGKNGIHKVLSDKKDYIFTPKEYKLPSMEATALAALANERLGCLKDKDNLSARKRLYHRLDVICPVEDVLNGKIPEEDIPRIKKALNLSPNKTLNLAGNFSAKIEEKCSPEFLVAGDASVCCMGLGTKKAVDYALNPGFGIFNVYFKDRIIANSLIWVNDKDTLVIDNIEVHPNYQHHDTYIREMYNQMINDMSKIYPNIVQGETYNDLELYDRHTPCGELKTWKPVKIDGNFYSDAEDMCFLIKGNTDVFTPNTRNRMAASDDDFLENFNEEPQQHPAPVF